MIWPYIVGAFGITVIAVIAFSIGYLHGEDKKNQNSQEVFNKGYRQGILDENQSWIEAHEKFDAESLPFRAQRIQANRNAMPRVDSAGPIRVHRARVRGDHRLPQNQDEKGNRRDQGVKPPRTKLIPPSTSAGDDMQKLAVERLTALGTDRAIGLAAEIERGRQRRQTDENLPDTPSSF